MIGFILGMLIGIAFGFIVCAVLTASRREEEILAKTLRDDEEEDTTIQ